MRARSGRGQIVTGASARRGVLATASVLLVAAGAGYAASSPSAYRAARLAAIECTQSNPAQASLPTDVGLANAELRRAHITALADKLRASAHTISDLADTVYLPWTRSRIRDTATDMRAFADALDTYLRVVPVATSSTEPAIVDAFVTMIDTQRRLTETCSQLVMSL